MISFINDYSEGAHPRILELMQRSNLEQNTGYGEDIHSQRAKQYIRREIGREEADIHFIPGGTQTNLLVVSSFLRPHQCVIAADTGHVNVHETGAIEATGHKVVTVPHEDGKLTPEGIRKVLSSHSGEHMVQPKMVYLSDTTELGTIYTKAELTAIRELCRQENLILFLDGARLASAISSTSNDLSLMDIAALVDVFYIGGTKNGALLGEALVICKEELKEDFRYMIKQRGAMMAKGFLLGIQFEALFEDGLYYELGAHANRMAEKLARALLDKGIPFYATVCSNQLFPILSDEMTSKMSERFGFLVQDRVDDKNIVIRLVTSWATSESNVDSLIQLIREL
jgi:threonine aldolase